MRSVDILEVHDAGGVAERLIADIGEIDGRRDGENQRVVAGAAVDCGFAAVIGDEIVACAGIDDVGPAAAVDGVGA